ncbi:NAD(P)H-binding protein [Paenibacillus sp. GSMTC-2017]|uniref:NAD(P)H-binding protein n=1 Tax=Paenibacillus sp. GSMTC-2017 TaxID=2794350 RepID=UPI0018D91FE6|nr:NAD(P)H-binding protein [Paenibacillus sp. GSMTC-2017]MBH5320517.1 NAD(P)H-binding protein [Paenibacillus sp. GSMTC-2017]
MERRAVIVGATGLVGGELVKLLLSSRHYTKVTVIVRKRLSMSHPRLEQRQLDFKELGHTPAELIEGADIYCTLGTTMKKAGSKEQFQLVDYDYPMELGRLCKRYGARKMLIVTAIGSSVNSMFFYSKVKGRVEQDLKALQLPSLLIFKPSLILGHREETSFRESFVIKAAEKLSFLFNGRWSKYKPVTANGIAQAMISEALTCDIALHIIESNEIISSAKKLQKIKG